jgi:hypothetical protein
MFDTYIGEESWVVESENTSGRIEMDVYPDKGNAELQASNSLRQPGGRTAYIYKQTLDGSDYVIDESSRYEYGA